VVPTPTMKPKVGNMMRVAWDTVGSIIQRVVARRQRPDLLDGLTHIGVDELSYRRHHEYITVVVDHRRGHVVATRAVSSASNASGGGGRFDIVA
jgi:transposase